jgi:hypothetical protein
VGWLPKGDAECDTCGAIRPGTDDRHMTIQMMRAAGWRHMKGTTRGGQDFETVLCPRCAKDEKRRTRSQEIVDQEALPLDWEEGRRVVGGQGSHTR